MGRCSIRCESGLNPAVTMDGYLIRCCTPGNLSPLMCRCGNAFKKASRLQAFRCPASSVTGELDSCRPRNDVWAILVVAHTTTTSPRRGDHKGRPTAGNM